MAAISWDVTKEEYYAAHWMHRFKTDTGRLGVTSSCRWCKYDHDPERINAANPSDQD